MGESARRRYTTEAVSTGIAAEGPADGSSDGELMLLLRSGDRAALEELLRRYWRPLVRYALRFHADLDAAEDVVQEAFVRGWQRWSQRSPAWSPRACLSRIVRNLVLQEGEKRGVRRKWREARRREAEEEVPPVETIEERLRNDALHEAIRSLPDRRREVIILARFHGFSYQHIAEVIGISPPTVA